MESAGARSEIHPAASYCMYFPESECGLVVPRRRMRRVKFLDSTGLLEVGPMQAPAAFSNCVGVHLTLKPLRNLLRNALIDAFIIHEDWSK